MFRTRPSLVSVAHYESGARPAVADDVRARVLQVVWLTQHLGEVILGVQ